MLQFSRGPEVKGLGKVLTGQSELERKYDFARHSVRSRRRMC